MIELLPLLKGYLPELSAAVIFILFIVQMYLNSVRDRRSENAKTSAAEAVNKFNITLMERIARLEAKVAQLASDNTELKLENQRLTSKMAVIESAHQSAPIPMWTKSKEGVMLSINEAYESEFLLPLGKTAEDYIGKTDIEFWESVDPDNAEAIAKDYGRNDLHVQVTKKLWLGTEIVTTKTGIKRFGIMKYPRLEGNFLIGIAGIAIPEKLMKEIVLDG